MMFNVPPQYELKRRNENNLVNYLLLSVKKVNVNYFCFDSLSLLELLKNSRSRCSFQQGGRQGKERFTFISSVDLWSPPSNSLWIYYESHNEALNRSPTFRRSDGGCPVHLVCRRCLHISIRRILVIVAIKIDDWTEQFAHECRQ